LCLDDHYVLIGIDRKHNACFVSREAAVRICRSNDQAHSFASHRLRATQEVCLFTPGHTPLKSCYLSALAQNNFKFIAKFASEVSDHLSKEKGAYYALLATSFTLCAQPSHPFRSMRDCLSRPKIATRTRECWRLSFFCRDHVCLCSPENLDPSFVEAVDKKIDGALQQLDVKEAATVLRLSFQVESDETLKRERVSSAFILTRVAWHAVTNATAPALAHRSGSASTARRSLQDVYTRIRPLPVGGIEFINAIHAAGADALHKTSQQGSTDSRALETKSAPASSGQAEAAFVLR
jgi:hypothetical protein